MSRRPLHLHASLPLTLAIFTNLQCLKMPTFSQNPYLNSQNITPRVLGVYCIHMIVNNHLCVHHKGPVFKLSGCWFNTVNQLTDVYTAPVKGNTKRCCLTHAHYNIIKVNDQQACVLVNCVKLLLNTLCW